jgi:lysophospholipase L1-like esterase
VAPVEVREPIGVVILGDSVAHTLAGGVVRDFPDFDPWQPGLSPFDPALVTLRSQARPGCSFLAGDLLTPGGTAADLKGFCRGWEEGLAADLTAAPGSVVVVMPSNDASDRLVDGRAITLGSPEHTALLADWLDEVAAMAGDHGGRLAVVALPPRSGRAAQAELRDVPREELLREELEIYARGRDDVLVLDLFEQICPRGDCADPARGFDPEWRYDGLHYSVDGARWVADWIARQLVAGGA